MSRKNAILPLDEKLNAAQMERRQTRISGRRTVAESLGRTQAMQAAVLQGHHNLLRRGFFGRMKWLIFGR